MPNEATTFVIMRRSRAYHTTQASTRFLQQLVFLVQELFELLLELGALLRRQLWILELLVELVYFSLKRLDARAPSLFRLK
jgi:hypothetical protein